MLIFIGSKSEATRTIREKTSTQPERNLTFEENDIRKIWNIGSQLTFNYGINRSNVFGTISKIWSKKTVYCSRWHIRIERYNVVHSGLVLHCDQKIPLWWTLYWYALKNMYPGIPEQIIDMKGSSSKMRKIYVRKFNRNDSIIDQNFRGFKSERRKALEFASTIWAQLA